MTIAACRADRTTEWRSTVAALTGWVRVAIAWVAPTRWAAMENELGPERQQQPSSSFPFLHALDLLVDSLWILQRGRQADGCLVRRDNEPFDGL